MQAPPVGVQPLGAPIAPQTYLEKYLDPATDPFVGNYINLYNEYAVGNTQPAALRTAVYRDGNVGTLLHGLVHVRDALAGPDDPGTILALHRLTRHDPRLGQVPQPYDNLGLAFFGDLVNGQLPTTVVIPDSWFNQTTQVQAPTVGHLAQLLAAQPGAEAFGPYQAGQADITPVVTRKIILVPNKYAAPFLSVGMKPREAYELLVDVIQQDGQDVACEPLIEWLRATLTVPGGNGPQVPVTAVLPAAAPTFINPQVQQAFAVYRLGIYQTDFPHHTPGHSYQSATLIAQGLSALTDEQRLTRQEAQQRQDAKSAQKFPRDLFGVLLDRLMRWCQVSSEADLPPIYVQLANTKKGQIRLTLQTAVEDALSNLKYVEDFPVSTSLATKLQELKWHTSLIDNLSTGVNIFCLGTLDEEAMEQQRLLNRHADTLYNGDASPSLIDIAAVQDSKHEVCIPRTFAQLRYLVERSVALWLVLLGNHHPLTQGLQAYRQALVSNEKRLELVSPKDPCMRNLVPALLARVIQLDMNAWFLGQMRSTAPYPLSPLTEIFKDIDRERHWEPRFPAGYLTTPVAHTTTLPSDVLSLGAKTAPTAASSLTGSSHISPSAVSHAPVPTQPENAIVRNVQYKEEVFGSFKAQGLKARTVKDSIKKRNVELPTNARGQHMCLTYHVHGVCNTRCKFATDHYAHTSAEDEALRAWCADHYKIAE